MKHKYSDFVKDQAELSVMAENLKEHVWAHLEKYGDTPFDIKVTINHLLDQIDSLEYDHDET
jgi:hypothetical protein